MSEDRPIWGTPEQYARAETFKAVDMAATLAHKYGFDMPGEFSTWAEHFHKAPRDPSAKRSDRASAAGAAALRTMATPEVPTPQDSMSGEAWIQALRYTVAASLLAESDPGRSVALSKLARDTLWMIHFIVTPPKLDCVPTWAFVGDVDDIVERYLSGQTQSLDDPPPLLRRWRSSN